MLTTAVNNLPANGRGLSHVCICLKLLFEEAMGMKASYQARVGAGLVADSGRLSR